MCGKHYQRWYLHGGRETTSRRVADPISPASKRKVLVTCSDCGKSYPKRRDSLRTWAGRCRSCAMVLMAQRPEMKELRRHLGYASIARHGGKLPAPKLENRRRGPANNMWRGGITPEHAAIRCSLEAKDWKRAVLRRDGYRCVACGLHNNKLEVDHIRPFSLYPALRFDLDNGRTLCKSCHGHYGALVFEGRVVREASFAYAELEMSA